MTVNYNFDYRLPNNLEGDIRKPVEDPFEDGDVFKFEDELDWRTDNSEVTLRPPKRMY
jgi:hypothetical protein